MVECNLAKVEVAGSNPVSRSIIHAKARCSDGPFSFTAFPLFPVQIPHSSLHLSVTCESLVGRRLFVNKVIPPAELSQLPWHMIFARTFFSLPGKTTFSFSENRRPFNDKRPAF